MRIVSTFKDYYDGVQAMGQDAGVVYVREQSKKISKELPEKINWQCYYYHKQYFSPIVYRVVGFCGKLYPLIEITYKEKETDVTSKKAYCYSIEDVDKVIHFVLSKKKLADYNKPKPKKSRWDYSHCRYKDEEFFQKRAVELPESFDLLGCPVFISRKEIVDRDAGYPYREYGSVLLNPLLKAIEFYRIKDAYTAFQDLYTFLSNKAEPRKVAPPISDELKAHTHGFNEESFRTPKGAKPNRKNRKKK